MMSQTIIIITLMLLLLTDHISSSQIRNSTCPTACGHLAIPFPFGTSSNCSVDEAFLITCNHTYNPPKPFLTSIEVLDISLDGLITVSSSVASDCYDTSGAQINRTKAELISSKFPISRTRNKFTAVGCDTYALVDGSDQEWKQMNAGCVSSCDSVENVVNATCNGIGCCQTSIPKGVKDFSVDIRSYRNHTRVKFFNPCGYAFVVEAEAFKFSSLDLKDLQKRKTVPVVLDWSIGYGTCKEASEDVSSYACRANHSECSDSSNGVGYRCNCLTGFEGNRYLAHGCQDIDECSTLKPCEGICKNFPGSYSCSCPKGFTGDGKKDGDGCHSESKLNGSAIFYIAYGFMVPAIGSSWIFWRRKQKKVTNLRKKLFYRNGGKLLESMLSNGRTLSIFTAEDLKRATNNYDENQVLHREQPFGIAYKGTFPGGDNQTVTIKKCEDIDVSKNEVFIRKLVRLSRVSHRNLIRLIGCCLEAQVPLLVYEFVDSKTLYDYIQDDDLARALSWDIRLRIAAETAGALASLHFDVLMPIIHGNLSSSSILLQEYGYIVKVNDFALASDIRFCVGNPGYLDPAYLSSGRLTVKSDVYSFGVILAELLTGKKVIDFERQEGEQLLAKYFVSPPRGDDLLSILDHRMEPHDKIEQITRVATLAHKCLSNSSVERPTMLEVAEALTVETTVPSCSEPIPESTLVILARTMRPIMTVTPR